MESHDIEGMIAPLSEMLGKFDLNARTTADNAAVLVAFMVASPLLRFAPLLLEANVDLSGILAQVCRASFALGHLVAKDPSASQVIQEVYDKLSRYFAKSV